MSASTNNRTTARVILPAAVLALMLSLVLSGVAAAMPTFDAPLIRHHSLKRQASAKKKTHKRSHRRRAHASATTVVFDLCAKAGTTTPPGAAGPIPTWSFADTCAGAAGAIGPVLNGITAGDTVTLNVTNQLPDPLSIDIPGVLSPQTVAAGAVAQAISFVAANPGTYLYESSGDAGRQSEVGLAGALVVGSGTPSQAYDAARSHYDSSAVMVLSEIDPALNAAADAGTLADFDMRTWHPTYRLINGEAYSDATPPITAAAGSKVLLRYVNAGSEYATMTMLGLDATMVGREGSLLSVPFGFVDQTFAAGATADAIVSVPGAASGTKFPIYDRHLDLANGPGATTPGGRIRFIQVS